MIKKLLSLCVLIAILGAVPAFAQEDRCFEKGGNWDAENQRCQLKSGLDIQISYPLELSEHAIVTQTVDTFIQAQRSQFLTYFTEAGFYPGVSYTWSLYIDYAISQFSEEVVSVNFTISDYTGGAHPNSYFQTFTFDLANERVIAFEDLFVAGADPLATIYPLVEANLRDQMGDEMADLSWIETGTGENPDNYKNFILTEDALVFLFPPYQVAAYAAGPFTVEIPLADLGSILAPEFVK